MPPPRLAIALPVYNGARYLPLALDALLSQSADDFVLIALDNASTDDTPDLLEQAALQDPRVRVVTHPENRGAVANFNAGFEEALKTGAPFFKWAAADDLVRPGYLAACLEALEDDPDAVVAHTDIRLVDDFGDPIPYDLEAEAFVVGEEGRWTWERSRFSALETFDPVERFRTLLHAKPAEWLIYGVFRTAALARTRRFVFPGVEDTLLAEVLLQGRLAYVRESLFDQRLHKGSSYFKTAEEYAAYSSGAGQGASKPGLRAAQFVRAVAGAPLSLKERARALAVLAGYAAGADRLKNLVVPGPNNYFGIGAGQETDPALRHG